MMIQHVLPLLKCRGDKGDQGGKASQAESADSLQPGRGLVAQLGTPMN